jgi:CheY-like chemotaxis protein
VLVVVVVALIRMTTVDMVEQLDFPVCEAADAPQALALLDQDDEIEILLTDLGLPGMDGRQLVEEALRLKPSLKVIIASGYSARTGDAKLAGAASHLTKPFDLARLKRALET